MTTPPCETPPLTPTPPHPPRRHPLGDTVTHTFPRPDPRAPPPSPPVSGCVSRIISSRVLLRRGKRAGSEIRSGTWDAPGDGRLLRDDGGHFWRGSGRERGSCAGIAPPQRFAGYLRRSEGREASTVADSGGNQIAQGALNIYYSEWKIVRRGVHWPHLSGVKGNLRTGQSEIAMCPPPDLRPAAGPPTGSAPIAVSPSELGTLFHSSFFLHRNPVGAVQPPSACASPCDDPASPCLPRAW